MKNVLDILDPTNVGPTRTHMPLLPESQRTVVNGVDIDRLHWVIENRPLVQRGAGKTFARIQEFLEIVFGLKNDINVSIYAKPEFEYTQMDIIRDALISGISDQKRIVGPIFKAVYMTDRDMTQKCRAWKPEIIYLRHRD